MPDVVMPRLSDSMEEGTIVSWLVEDGATVGRGDEIVEIETDKATMAYAAESDGTLTITAAAGATLAIGAPIATIVGAGEEAPSSGPVEHAPVAATRSPDDGARRSREASRPAAASGPRPKASPVARRIAQEHGLDLAGVSGTGPDGRILKADALRAIADGERPAGGTTGAVPPTTSRDDVLRAPGRIERLVAERMVLSRTEIPEFVVTVDIDLEKALAMRADLKDVADEGAAVPSVNDLIVKACGLALREHPRVNSAWTDEGIVERGHVNVGVAVATDDGGLVVPVVADADAATLGDIARRSRDLAVRARTGAITPAELTGGTFTVSNLGMMGVASFTAIITPGQGAILAVGGTTHRYVPVDGVPTARPIMTVSLCSDHRIIYGAHAAAFLGRVKALIERPAGLAL